MKACNITIWTNFTPSWIKLINYWLILLTSSGWRFLGMTWAARVWIKRTRLSAKQCIRIKQDERLVSFYNKFAINCMNISSCTGIIKIHQKKKKKRRKKPQISVIGAGYCLINNYFKIRYFSWSKCLPTGFPENPFFFTAAEAICTSIKWK